MNAGKIRTELYQGKTINQICNTYHMTFKQLFDLLHQTKTVDTEKTPKYILKAHARYFIQKNINGDIKIFGSFYNRKEAEKVLDKLIQHDWELPFHERAGILYVYEKKPDNFIIRYYTQQYGRYGSCEDAIKVRNMLYEFDWDMDYLNLICRKLGVERLDD